MPKPEQLGDRLAQLRREKAAQERRDITAANVADRLKISRPTYSRYEANLTRPDDDTLGKLADYFGVTRSWLRFGEGEREAAPTTAVEVVAGPADRKRRGAASPTKRRTAGQ